AVVILVILGVFLFTAVIGIVAAVALPAYQDYMSKVKVSTALIELAPLKLKVEEYYLTQGRLPMENSELGLDDPHTIAEGNTVTITQEGLRIDFNEQTPGLYSETLTLTPVELQSSIVWECFGGTLENKYRPPNCRN
ncbi:MAG: hypothetical protein COA42_01795, partial [Alteromonadaceae bacterium]